MTERDETGELHLVVPPAFEGGIFLVLVQNNETDENYTEHFMLFHTETDAERYAATFTQHWIRTKIVLLPNIK